MKPVVVPVSRDGTVTIPEDVLECLGGDSTASVEFVMRDDGAIEIRPATNSLDGIFGPLPDADDSPADRVKALGLAARLMSAERSKRVLG